jgi:hypothetical protein
MVKYKSIAIAAAVAATLAGCAPQLAWEKTGQFYTAQEFNADKLRCLQASNAAVGDTLAFGSFDLVALSLIATATAKKDVFNTCMQALGWSLAPLRRA